MPDIIAPPPIFVGEIKGIFVGDACEVTLVGIVVAVIAKCVVGVKLQLGGIAAL